MQLTVVSPINDASLVRRTAGKIIVTIDQRDWSEIGGTVKAVITDTAGNVIYTSSRNIGVSARELDFDTVWPEVIQSYTITAKGYDAVGNEKAICQKVFTVKE